MIRQIKVKILAGPLERDSMNIISSLVEQETIPKLWWRLVENSHQISINPLENISIRIRKAPFKSDKWVHR